MKKKKKHTIHKISFSVTFEDYI